MLIVLNGKANAEQVVEALKFAANKGANIYVSWKREVKTLKATTQRVEKLVTASVRYGVDFANMASVKAGIEAGTREDVAPLPKGTAWRKGFDGLILDNENTGSELVRFAVGTFANAKRSVEFLVDGQPATKEQVAPLCLASEFRERTEPLLTFNLKPEYIQGIGVAE